MRIFLVATFIVHLLVFGSALLSFELDTKFIFEPLLIEDNQALDSLYKFIILYSALFCMSTIYLGILVFKVFKRN
jgi:hypothetical protein